MQTELVESEIDCEPLLIEREERITRAQRNAYLEIGLDLKAIRDNRWYRAKRSIPVDGRYSFNTFEEYCETRWEMSRVRAHQLIECAEVSTKMLTIVNKLPTSESHVRELLKLQDDADRAEVWRRVAQNGGNITARSIAEAVEKYKAEQRKDWFTVDDWKALTSEKRLELVGMIGNTKLNAPDTDSIEWARWSWNPITGCKHGCKYCYARDIAARFFPQGFAPTFLPSRLSAPANTQPPNEKSEWTDVDKIGFKNVFVCSMADLFGKWVPSEWIEAVLERIEASPQWNFLLLTKFPIRMAEFEFPKNAWVGTTVDTQSAVSRAEKAFSTIKAGLKWLSCEPMMERLTFNSLDMFSWVVVGGASASVAHEQSELIDESPATPEWRPPFEWIQHLYSQAKSSKCKVYMKTNLLGDRVREYPSTFR